MKKLTEQTESYLNLLRQMYGEMVTGQYPSMDVRRMDMVETFAEFGFNVTLQTLDVFTAELMALTETESDRNLAANVEAKAEAKSMKSKPVSFKVGQTVKAVLVSGPNRGQMVQGVVEYKSGSGKSVKLDTMDRQTSMRVTEVI